MNSLSLKEYNFPESIEDLSAEQIKEVYRHVQFDNYKIQLKSKIKELNFDVDEKVNRWLKNKATHTDRMYRLYFKEFIEYIGVGNILKIDNYFVDNYFNDVIVHFGEGKGRMFFASISSFYSSLFLWGDIDRNPFKGIVIKFPETIKKSYKMIEKEDIKKIKNCISLNKESHLKMRIAIHLMENYGVRVGFFNSSISFGGNDLVSISKGKVYKICVKDDDFITQNMDTLLKINGATVQSTLRNIVTKLYNKGELKRKYTPHDFRHFYAINQYLLDKDIYRLSKNLNHSGIKVTETYLKGMGI